MEVVSSNPAVDHEKIFFSIGDLLSLSISIFIIKLYQLMIQCSSKVLLL